MLKKKTNELTVFNLPNLSDRRVVELQLLAKELWCKNCDNPLSLRHVIEENCMGLASILKMKCFKCQLYFDVHTNKPHDSYNRLYDVNYKLSIGKWLLLFFINTLLYLKLELIINQL